MPAAVHILHAQQQLLERVIGPGTALWIAADQRAVDHVRILLAYQSQCCFLPRLLTFADFAAALVAHNDPAARPIGDVERRLLLDAVVAELHGKGDLSYFDAVIDTRGFAEGVSALIADLKSAEIWPGQLARAGYRRGYPGTDVGRRIGQRIIRRKDRQVARLYARYQHRLRQANQYDAEGILWHARDLLARGCRTPFKAIRTVCVDGFVHFTRTQIEMLQALAGWVEEMWITLPDEPGDARAELFTRGRQTRARLAARGLALAETLKGESQLSANAAGLAHIEQQLFRPLRTITLAGDAGGILLIKAPGALGEARLAARHVKQLLLDGTPAGDIVVALRDVEPYADLIDEVFTEYGIPIELEGTLPLARNPAVATLLKARRLAEDGWPFAGVAALLRSTCLQPDWPEVQSDPTVPAQAEALLRLLGEPAGRDAFLAAVQLWIDHPPPPLEDEEDDTRLRNRLRTLAPKCQPFLKRFFASWDDQPGRASPREQVAWLQRLAETLGIGRLPSQASASSLGGFALAQHQHHQDQAALQMFFRALDHWVTIEQNAVEGPAFGGRLLAVASVAGLPRSPNGPGRVRVLSAEQACLIDVPHLIIIGLGEGSFPDLSAPDPILDDFERQAFARAGLDLPPLRDRMSDEMLLFYRLVTRARRQLVLSYPAVDEQGQERLPSSFLTALLDCFQPDTVPVVSRRLLIEGYGQETPLSPAELRFQSAQQIEAGPVEGIGTDLSANLRDAALIADQRHRQSEFTAYDGLLRHPAVLAEVQRLFGPERLLSPTALEDYVDCPFRFFMGDVLRLAPLDDPQAEIEPTGRGLVLHRALARLHRRLREAGTHQPHDQLGEQLQTLFDDAVREQLAESASPVARELWRLEALRLQRSLSRYPGHWEKFLAPWRERQAAPQPSMFEVGFDALRIEVDGVAVRLGGRIDRVDVAEIEETLGFWIIDYKTGSTQYARTRRELGQLQLPIYALAVEEVLLAGQPARPLGLAYWMVTGTGCKLNLPAKPADWLADAERWPRLRDQLKTWVATLARRIRQGDFPLKPRSENCSDHCDFGQVCRISQSRSAVERKDWQLPLPVVE